MSKTIIDFANRLGFEVENEYFNYALESFANGQYSQYMGIMKEMRDIWEIGTILDYISAYKDNVRGCPILYYAKMI